ncbi:MAG: mitochondrial 2-enoyl thioester reductase [Icmadophila ericetorum]|nr:mitochondrial 2-enoyl thioester reductase [Icmadophila ericetorum]
MRSPPIVKSCTRSLAKPPLPSHRLPLDSQRHISAYGYTQAKCLVYPKHGEPKDVLDLHSHSISPPHKNLVTLRTLAAPLNPADINQIQGVYPSRPEFTTSLGYTNGASIAIPGNEGCFEVLSVGSAVKSVQKGDWVIARQTGLGTWRTHLQVEEDRILRVEKEGLKPMQPATVGVNPVTAWRMLTDFVTLDTSKGDWFIQNGANSGVGRAAIQLGKKWGFKNIAVVRDRPGEEGLKLRKELEDLGATKVITEEQLQSQGFCDQVKEWTDGGRESIRLALNCVGGKPAHSLAKLLSSNGHIITYGAMSKQPLSIPAGMLIFKNLVFEGFWVSKWSDQHPEEKKKTVEQVLEWTRRGVFVDTPFVEVPWEWGTGKSELVEAVQGTLEGYRKGKGIFVFGDT